jgi:hypothetical protein
VEKMHCWHVCSVKLDGGGKVGEGEVELELETLKARCQLSAHVLPFAPRSSLWFTLFHVIGVLVFTD